MHMLEESTKEEAIELELPHTDKSRFVKIAIGDAVVAFSYSRFGDTMDCHIAANKKGKLLTRMAVDVFCRQIFVNYDIKKITGTVHRRSVVNLLLKCGFERLAIAKTTEGDAVIMRLWRKG